MLEITNDLLPLIQKLIPGFLMTMTFYWFAEVPKPGQFDRTLQALVGTALIQASMLGIQQAAYFIGDHCFSLGPWSNTASDASAILIGGFVGLCLAYFCNNDGIYAVARKLGLTSKASTDDSVHVYQKMGEAVTVLHLKDGKRLMGYLETFPVNKENGTFLLTDPHWVHTGQIVRCTGTYAILITSSDVQWVEFLEGNNEQGPSQGTQ